MPTAVICPTPERTARTGCGLDRPEPPRRPTASVRAARGAASSISAPDSGTSSIAPMGTPAAVGSGPGSVISGHLLRRVGGSGRHLEEELLEVARRAGERADPDPRLD